MNYSKGSSATIHATSFSKVAGESNMPNGHTAKDWFYNDFVRKYSATT